jgi:hypothetical protein
MTSEREKEIRDILKLPIPPFDSPVTSMLNYYKSAMQELLNEIDRLRDQDKYFRQDSNTTYWLNLNSKALQECERLKAEKQAEHEVCLTYAQANLELRQKMIVAENALEFIGHCKLETKQKNTSFPTSEEIFWDRGVRIQRAQAALVEIRGEK